MTIISTAVLWLVVVIDEKNIETEVACVPVILCDEDVPRLNPLYTS